MRNMRMPSVMPSSQRFAQVPGVSIQRSVFDRSHGHKLTFDAGLLVPIFVDDVIPGDTLHLSMTGIVRLTTPIKPLMDNLFFETFFFFVPYRLVWSNFQKFMGEQVNPGDSISFVVPSLGVPYTPVVGDIHDYFGTVPQNIGAAQIQTPTKISALPYRAYNLTYNQWFRDENLINSLSVPVDDGPDSTTLYSVRKRGKRHDYFTSCMPFLQKGGAVPLPLGSSVPVIPSSAAAGAVPPYTGIFDYPEWKTPDGTPSAGVLRGVGGADPSNVQIFAGANWDANTILNWSNTRLKADLSVATSATINDLRQAFQIQKLLERDARGGTRYTEIIRSHFGVVSPDARLQRPEYLGGGSTPIMISPVAQQTQTGLTGGTTPIGNLSGIGAAAAFGHGFHKSFTEHGVVIGLANVRADLTYQQGVERYWFKQTRYDFYWPEFAHIGEQSVLNREIFFSGTTALNAQDNAVFGYQERYAEYRYKPSRLSGLFRSNATGTLEIWHLSEDFAALPTLGQTFIEDQTSGVLGTRVAVPAEPDLYGDLYFKYRCARPMPVFGVPGLIDHF